MNQQQKAMQQPDARMAKRIKVEHGEELASSLMDFGTPSPSPLPPVAINGPTKGNGQTTSNSAINLPTGRASQQMGPPLSSRPSISSTLSQSNVEGMSPVAQTGGATHSPSPQPQGQGSKGSVGPGRVPYQFGMGLPSAGINFTRTPTTGSFVASNSNSNSRQHTPTDPPKAPSRASPPEVKTTIQQAPTPAVDTASTSSGGGSSRNTGVDQLQDLLSISGVDLKAEEEAAQRNTMARTSFNTANTAAINQASSPSQLRQAMFFLEIYPLSRHIHRIAAKSGLRVEPEVLTYLSLAARTRFQNLLEAMIASSRHRNWSSHTRPPPLYESNGQAMYHEEIHDDPMKLLAALSRVEKKEEHESRQARLRKEEMEASNANSGQTAEGGGEGESSGQATPAESGGVGEDGKKKGKKPGTSSTAKNMSEDKRLKLANKTAAQALGISSNSKAWMFGGTSGGNSPFGNKKGSAAAAAAGGFRLPKPRFAPVAKEAGDSNGQEGEEGGVEQQGEDSQGGGGFGKARSGSQSVGRWGDLAARQRLKEEEESLARRSVNLQDALHALEMERSGGAGRGSGELMLYSTMALGRPPTRKL
ncbi:hypothetical protein CBS101457_005320 [Exobasidium rhododendri]|nr:hypothetical protein CBS101457_005320 [Exobasidium rhododendri]